MATLSLKGGIPDELKSSAGAYLKMPSVQVELEEAVNLVDVHQFMSGIILSEQDDMFDSITSVYGINITDIHSIFDVLVKDLSMLISELEGLLDTVNPSFGFTIEDTLEALDGYSSGSFPGSGNYPGASTYPGVGEFVSLVVATAMANLSEAEGILDSTSTISDFVKTLTDSLGITDTQIKAISTFLSEGVSVTDLLDISSGFGVSVSDAAGITDSAYAAMVASVSNALGITDSAFVEFGTVVSDSTGLTDTVYWEFSLEILEIVGLQDLLDAILTIGKQHIHVDTMVVRVGQHLIDISVKDMSIQVGVESYTFGDEVGSVGLNVGVEKIKMTDGVDEAITEPPVN